MERKKAYHGNIVKFFHREEGRFPSLAFILLLFLSTAFSRCSHHNIVRPGDADGGSYTLEAKYTAIRSYGNGGGVFLISMTPGDDFSGEVVLTISADPLLNAALDRDKLNLNSRIAELTVRPSQSIEVRSHQIGLVATHSGTPRSILLEVEVFQWDPMNTGDAIEKRNEILEWLEREHPEFGNFSSQEWFAYMTYPEIIIVEHWTFLNPEWEMRICYHVMIPPHDWSMLAIRRRGELEFLFAAKRESDGTLYEIPVSEYPTMFGY